MQKEINTYLEWKGSYAPRAAKIYRAQLFRFVELTKVQSPQEITRQHVVDFQVKLSRKYADSYVALSMVVVKNFLQYLQDEGVPSLKPHTIRIPKYSNKSYTHITVEEFEEMDEWVSGDAFKDLRMRVMLHLLWYSGVRVSELCDMDISMIDNVRHGALIITKKSQRKDWIFWPPETHALIKHYVNIRLCHSSKEGLFLNNRNQRLTTRSVQRFMRDLAMKVGIDKKIVPHSFRHGRAHRILDLGGNVKDVQWWLRHSERNPAASFQYLRLNPTEREKRAKKLF